MKRVIGNLIVVLFLLSIFGCKENKAGQGSSAKDSTSIAGDSTFSEKVVVSKDIASHDTLSAVIVNIRL
mgnify:CR=1 FL=1